MVLVYRPPPTIPRCSQKPMLPKQNLHRAFQTQQLADCCSTTNIQEGDSLQATDFGNLAWLWASCSTLVHFLLSCEWQVCDEAANETRSSTHKHLKDPHERWGVGEGRFEDSGYEWAQKWVPGSATNCICPRIKSRCGQIVEGQHKIN